MNHEEFVKIIESIEFKNDYGFYYYKEFKIYLRIYDYSFYNGYEWFKYDYTDLTPELLKLIRSYKLKELLR